MKEFGWEAWEIERELGLWEAKYMRKLPLLKGSCQGGHEFPMLEVTLMCLGINKKVCSMKGGVDDARIGWVNFTS